MESNLVRNNTNDYQNRTTANRESDFFNHEYDYRQDWTDKKDTYQLIKTMTKFEKETRYQLTRRNARQQRPHMTRFVPSYDMTR